MVTVESVFLAGATGFSGSPTCWTTKRTLPTAISSPGWRLHVLTGSPLTSVVFLLPRSFSISAAPRASTWQCLRDTWLSRMLMSQEGSLPMVSGLPSSVQDTPLVRPDLATSWYRRRLLAKSYLKETWITITPGWRSVDCPAPLPGRLRHSPLAGPPLCPRERQDSPCSGAASRVLSKASVQTRGKRNQAD